LFQVPKTASIDRKMETELENEFVSPSYEIPAETRRQYFHGVAPQIRLSLAYQLGLAAVLVAMILLPLVYLGLIGLTAWGTYRYAVAGMKVLGGTHSFFGILLFYVGPIVAGLVLIFFMIKPVFYGLRYRQFGIPISHTEHPEFFRFLGQLCQLLGAPIPSRVDVQLGVNASAGFRAGFSSLFGNDIMLRIGLPLVAGLNCQEFAGSSLTNWGIFASGPRCVFAT
jgi:hypothetical protein